MMVHAPPPPRPPTQSSTVPLHRPPVTTSTTSYNSRHVIASPFDIPSLGCVTTTTSHSNWPDLMSSSYNMSRSVSSNSSVNNGSNSRVTRPVSSLPAHQPPLVFPSNPEPFQGLKFIVPITLIEHTVKIFCCRSLFCVFY